MIITLAESKKYLNIATLVTETDTFLTCAIQESQSYIEDNICQQPIEAANETIRFFGNGTRYENMANFPLNTVTELTKRVDPIADLSTVLVTTYTLTSIDDVWKIYNNNGFNLNDIYTAVINIGYLATEIPRDIKQVAKEMVYIYYYESNLKSEGRLGVSSITDTNMNSTVTRAFDNKKSEWIVRLEPYRKPTL